MWEGLQAVRKEIQESVNTIHDNEEIHDGFQLRFVGKSYAKFVTGLPSETVLVPDNDWNNQENNKDSQNIFITGDNLDALKHLVNAYSGAIKMIYIDPPYNTGSDGFVYKDNFNFSNNDLKQKLGFSDTDVARLRALEGKCSHSAWLTFMLPRLMLAKYLLKDTGSIFISIDYNEAATLKLLCDEIFGETNFQREIVWRIGWLSGYKTTAPNFIRNHDTMLFYSRNSSKMEFIKKYIQNKDFKPLVKKEAKLSEKMSELGLNTNQQNELLDFINYINRPDKYPLEDTWNSNEYDDLNSIAIVSFSGEKISKLLNINQEFKGQKSIKMLIRLLEATTKDSDIILDFFAGTSSTAHAVMQLNKEDGGTRKYIMVQIPEKCQEDTEAYRHGFKTIDEISRERIKRAAAQIGDTSGFKHYKLAKVTDDLILDKIDEFDPTKPNLLSDDMVSPFSGNALGTGLNASGLDTLLTTWMVDDGYPINTKMEEFKFGNYVAYSPVGSRRLYLISDGWDSNATQDLLNKIGRNEISVQTIIIYNHSFNFTMLTELKNNLKHVLDDDKKIEIIERF